MHMKPLLPALPATGKDLSSRWKKRKRGRAGMEKREEARLVPVIFFVEAPLFSGRYFWRKEIKKTSRYFILSPSLPLLFFFPLLLLSGLLFVQTPEDPNTKSRRKKGGRKREVLKERGGRRLEREREKKLHQTIYDVEKKRGRGREREEAGITS